MRLAEFLSAKTTGPPPEWNELELCRRFECRPSELDEDFWGRVLAHEYGCEVSDLDDEDWGRLAAHMECIRAELQYGRPRA